MIHFKMMDEMAIFKAFTEKEKKAFIKMDHEILTYQQGELILKENELSNDLYLLLSGTCLVTRTQEDRTIQLAKLKPGELFGEMSMATNLPRRTNVMAKNDAIVLRMDGSFFEKIHSKMSLKIHNHIIALLCARLDKMNEGMMRISRLIYSR